VFGSSVAIAGDTALVGAPGDDASDPYAGSAYVLVRGAARWSEQAKLTASDAAAFDYFGNSVAIAGDLAVIGAPGDDAGGADAGSVYVFARRRVAWSEQAKLTAADAAPGDQFGGAVAVAGDTIVVGAPGGDGAGSVHVFVRSGASWVEQAELTGTEGFGSSVAVAGHTLVVGSPAAGAAHVFVRSGAAWSEQARLTSDGAGRDAFGFSVSVSDDTVVVAAIGNDAGGIEAGAVHVFVRSGARWSEQAKLTASDAAAAGHFGSSVAVSGDTIVVGATGDDAAGATDAGATYVFVRTGAVWSERAKLTSKDAAAFDYFGNSVAIAGETALVGAQGDDRAGSSNHGSAHVFSLDRATFAGLP
jgi:hypothetical protein